LKRGIQIDESLASGIEALKLEGPLAYPDRTETDAI